MPREIKKKKEKKCILYKKIIARTRALVNCIRVFRLSIKTFDASRGCIGDAPWNANHYLAGVQEGNKY